MKQIKKYDLKTRAWLECLNDRTVLQKAEINHLYVVVGETGIGGFMQQFLEYLGFCSAHRNNIKSLLSMVLGRR